VTEVHAGRPASATITAALKDAAYQIMISDGYSKLSVDGIITQAKTNRPAFYRRFPSVGFIAFEVIRDRFGTGRTPAEPSLFATILQLQLDDVTMFTSDLLRKNLPGLLEAVRTDSELRDLYRDLFIVPRRLNVETAITAAAKRGEIADGVRDLDLICDLLVGPLLARAILPLDVPIDAALAEETTKVACAVLGLVADDAARANSKGAPNRAWGAEERKMSGSSSLAD
jgi:AcrR family transcriptional regulator